MPVTIDYELEEGAGGSSQVVVVPVPADAAPPKLFGRAIVRPFVRDQKNDFATAAGKPRIEAAIIQVLGTRCADPTGTSLGELPARPEFGSLLFKLRHRSNNPDLLNVARVYCRDALRRWMPKLIVRDIPITQERKFLYLAISYEMVDPSGAVVASGRTKELPVPI